MDAWLETCSTVGALWLGWVFERSLASALCLAVVLIALAALPRRRLSGHLPAALLLLPLVVLLLPLERALPLPQAAWRLPVTIAALPVDHEPTAPTTAPAAPAARPDHAAPSAATAVPPLVHRTPVPWALLAMALCSAVAFAGGVRLWRRHVSGERVLRRQSRPAGQELQREFRRLARHAGAGSASLRLHAGLPSPLVTGLRRPVVYLPADLAQALAPPQLQFVLRHELEHVRRHDVLIAAFVATAQLLFWFHPGVWVTSALLLRWRELACDDAALAGCAAPSRIAVADALYTLIERACGPALPTAAFARLVSPRKFMERRLTRILDPHRRPCARLTLPAVLLLGCMTTVALAAARAQQPATSAAQDPEARSSDPTAVALEEAAAWLLEQQQADGRWAIGADPQGFNQRDHNEVCVTAVAIRALLPGLTDQKLRIARAVQKAATFLQKSQQVSGQFGPDDVHTQMYAHAHALRALCDVQRNWPDAGRLECIVRGVRFAEKARNPYGVWRYQPRDADGDAKITGAMMLALLDAKALGIAIDPAAIKTGVVYYEALTDPVTGRTGYLKSGERPSRFTSKAAAFPAEFSEENTAVRLLVGFAMTREGMRPPAEVTEPLAIGLLTALPPRWDVKASSIDLTYWEWGAAVMAQVGGDAAMAWRKALHDALLPNRVAANGKAHWPAIDASSHAGMEAWTTAAAMLALRALR